MRRGLSVLMGTALTLLGVLIGVLAQYALGTKSLQQQTVHQIAASFSHPEHQALFYKHLEENIRDPDMKRTALEALGRIEQDPKAREQLRTARFQDVLDKLATSDLRRNCKSKTVNLYLVPESKHGDAARITLAGEQVDEICLAGSSAEFTEERVQDGAPNYAWTLAQNEWNGRFLGVSAVACACRADAVGPASALPTVTTSPAPP
ncbi:hypothetical protein JY651_21845 [Pyxidicoccus parkwayensis]|uniref:HEAT repeat domain-containing protein n=1 Tax=Pyxidicoccus parkwayensis TaxID=2813578 RepID=A0ABX7PAG6_9BACT|nr:hypothetical protein [Pyxidicoccus parkwaysis]QSQ27390.1 hypothetical protein JY651_21845 [Pyxidicoccus parkwaysis]